MDPARGFRGQGVAGFLVKMLALAGLVFAVACGGEGAPAGAGARSEPPPPPPPAELAPLVGEYAEGGDTLSVLEEGGEFFVLPWGEERRPLDEVAVESPEGVGSGAVPGSLTLEGRTYRRLQLGGEGEGSFKIDPVRPPGELREEALAATPPAEAGDFLPPDLVEVVTLDSTVLLDARYATTNNFMGEVFYSSPRVFLQRPAAEALVRAGDWLKERGYGLLLHDGYRPWYVTKMFWDATPEELKTFVANPANGSRHNRGCAIDLTLYELETGEPVTMPGGYDEMSPRSYVDYQGGTSRQRWFRDLLRTAMEAQGFRVYEAEWWHFDHEDWPRYGIQNLTFEEIGSPVRTER